MTYAPLLFVPMLALGGWSWWRIRKFKFKRSSSRRPIPKEYFVGLNYLLNEQPDKAVDVFIRMLEVDSDTVETHLALGSLFRRRGEVDRAIRIHQNLIARPQLNRDQRIHALAALGNDYMSAGVLDRAERLFQEVVDIGGESSEACLKNLIDIYQQEKAWEKAIAVAERYEAVSGCSMHLSIGHYYCELAARASNDNNIDQAMRFLRKAQSVDNTSVRASLMLGDLYCRQGKYKPSIRAYNQVLEQDADYIAEVLQPLRHAYEQVNRREDFIQFLKYCQAQTENVAVVIELAACTHQLCGTARAIEVLNGHLIQYPSLRGIYEMIRMQPEIGQGEAQQNLTILKSLLERLLQSRHTYRCENCGFKGKSLHWLCPGCRQWNVSKPVHGNDNE